MYRFPWVSVIVTLSLVLLILLAAEKIIRPQGQNVTIPQPVTVTPAVPGQPGGFPNPPGGTSNPTASLAAAADAAVRADLKESAKLLAEAAANTDHAEKQNAVWEADIEPLKENADGRAVAAHADLARQMAYLLQQPRPTKSDLKLASERIAELQTEIDRLSALVTAQRLTPEQTLEIQELQRRSREANRQLTEAVERATAIAREARRQQPASVAAATIPTTPFPQAAVAPIAAATIPPLATAAASTASPSAEPPASAAAAAPPTVAPAAPTGPDVSQSQPSPGKTLQEKVAEIDDQNKIAANQKKMDQDAKRKRDDEDARQKKEEEGRRRAVEEAWLMEEARSEEVQRVLQPFLTKRNLQPRLAGASLQWQHTTNLEPMSLLALENVGALDDTVQGLSMLARVGSHRELSSPRWDYNPSSRTWSGDTQDRLKQAQDLLRRLGPTLVKEHLLSP